MLYLELKQAMIDSDAWNVPIALKWKMKPFYSDKSEHVWMLKNNKKLISYAMNSYLFLFCTLASTKFSQNQHILSRYAD